MGVAAVGDDVHAESARDAHNRHVAPEEVHDEPGYATVARVCHGAFEQGTAEATPTVRRQDREADLGEITFEGDMRRADELMPIVVNAENRIADEIDSIDVGSDGLCRKRRSEAQALVLQRQREKVSR